MPTSHLRTKSTWIALTALGSLAFWGALDQIQRPGGPHPGLKDEALKEALRKDRQHDELSYIKARAQLFGEVDGNGRKAECRYTGKMVTYIKQPLPNKAAVEHAWPITRLPEAARSDLHLMFVTQPEARLARANLHYGKVLVPVWSSGGSRSGVGTRGLPVFEVRPEQRGDVARAMFYTATMYGLSLPEYEEKLLRQWHEDDPVSKEEQERNARVARAQRSTNPFVLHPSLTQRIGNF